MVMTYRENGKFTRATPDPTIMDGIGPPINHEVFYNRTVDEWAIGYVDDDTGLFIQRASAPTQHDIHVVLMKGFNI